MPPAKSVKVTRNGQTTIPKEIRGKFGIEEGSILLVEAGEDAIILRPVPRLEALAGSLSRFGPSKKWKEELDRAREVEG